MNLCSENTHKHKALLKYAPSFLRTALCRVFCAPISHVNLFACKIRYESESVKVASSGLVGLLREMRTNLKLISHPPLMSAAMGGWSLIQFIIPTFRRTTLAWDWCRCCFNGRKIAIWHKQSVSPFFQPSIFRRSMFLRNLWVCGAMAAFKCLLNEQ